jgi:ABC-type multidrug transport system ATPase subunit
MLLGLIAADSGHIRIFDHEVPLAIDEVIGQVGAIVEQPRFFPACLGAEEPQIAGQGDRRTTPTSSSGA